MKQRLDLILVERDLAPTRSIAQAMIMAGEVSHNTTKLTKPGQLFDVSIELTVADKPRYVSRGGDKLASVAQALNLDFTDAVVLDVGSSTGGFTDYILQHGAQHVYAVDVGSNQLAYRLRQDERITLMEQTDIREVASNQLIPPPTIAVIDVSFISLTMILSAVAQLIAPHNTIIAMAKPQFETDKPTADRYHGVISDPKIRQKILTDFENWLSQHSFTIAAARDSQVAGAKGNVERFYRLQPPAKR